MKIYETVNTNIEIIVKYEGSELNKQEGLKWLIDGRL
jgi:hypothetical protein